MAKRMPELSPDQAIREAGAGELRPVYVVHGEERHHRRRVVEAMRGAALGPQGESAGASLNEDIFEASEVDVAAVLAAARTLPMFGSRRLVMLRGVERWETKDDARKAAKSRARGVHDKPLDRLADYLADPSESTTLLIVADKLDSRRRLVSAAKKGGFLVACHTPPRRDLPSWIQQRERERGHEISSRAADLLSELSGTDLCTLSDALDRVELFVGPGKPLEEDAITRCVANLQATSVWDLVGAVGRRDLGAALTALDRVFEPGSGPRLVGLLTWSVRQLIRFASARRAGLSQADAARQAGVPPFKVGEIARQARELPLARAERWLEALSRVDRDLKGGSRLPQKAVLETALLEFCQLA